MYIHDDCCTDSSSFIYCHIVHTYIPVHTYIRIHTSCCAQLVFTWHPVHFCRAQEEECLLKHGQEGENLTWFIGNEGTRCIPCPRENYCTCVGISTDGRWAARVKVCSEQHTQQWLVSLTLGVYVRDRVSQARNDNSSNIESEYFFVWCHIDAAGGFYGVYHSVRNDTERLYLKFRTHGVVYFGDAAVYDRSIATGDSSSRYVQA